MANILISVVISTRNKPPQTLKKTLFSIFKGGIEDYEVIIVDQNNNEKIKNFILELKNTNQTERNKLIYIKSNKIGLSNGRNLGMKYAKGKWILFFDDDAILPPGGFQRIEVILRKEDEKIFYGRVLSLEEKKPLIKRSFSTHRLHIWNFDTICSIGLIFSRSILIKIGNFDERFGTGSEFGAGEEGDIILRALKKDFKIEFLKNFVVFHPKPSLDLNKKFAYGYGLGALYRKHIFSGVIFFLTLGVKFILEIFLRLILGLSLYFKRDSLKAELHLSYLKGYLKGFLSYHK